MNLSHHESHHSPWDFPCKPSSYWGTPMVPGPPPYKAHLGAPDPWPSPEVPKGRPRGVRRPLARASAGEAPGETGFKHV